MTSLQPFVKLADPDEYVACPWDLAADEEGRTHWVEFFKRHLETILSLGLAAERARGGNAVEITRRAAACRIEFCEHFDLFAADPHAMGRPGEPVTIL